jgi:hypothetical protein
MPLESPTLATIYGIRSDKKWKDWGRKEHSVRLRNITPLLRNSTCFNSDRVYRTTRDILFGSMSWSKSARWKSEMVKVYLCLIKHHAIKVYAADVYIQAFVTSALDGGTWSATRSGSFKPVELAPLHYRQVGRSGLEKAPAYPATRGAPKRTEY